MFGIKPKAKCIDEARRYLAKVRPVIEYMTGKLDKSSDKAMAEIFGGIFFLYLGRECADMKHIRPYLGEQFAKTMRHCEIAPADLAKRVAYMNACWDTYEKVEKNAIARRRNPIIDILSCEAASGVSDMFREIEGFEEIFNATVNMAIERLGLQNYQKYRFPGAASAPAASAARPAPASPRASSPAPAQNKKTITLRNEQGNVVEFVIADTIAYQNQTYVCLENAKTGEVRILRVILKPDGTTAYGDPGPVMADIIMELSAKRNPVRMLSGQDKTPKTITLTDEKGKNVVFEVVDVIPHQGRTYVCLLGEGEDMLTILETTETPDGQGSYSSVDNRTAEMVYGLFMKRNPDMIG